MAEDAEEIIGAFMANDTRAQDLHTMREALRERLRALKTERNRVIEIEEAMALERRIVQLREQIAALGQEEAISQFVEDSLRVALARPMPNLEENEEEA